MLARMMIPPVAWLRLSASPRRAQPRSAALTGRQSRATAEKQAEQDRRQGDGEDGERQLNECQTCRHRLALGNSGRGTIHPMAYS